MSISINFNSNQRMQHDSLKQNFSLFLYALFNNSTFLFILQNNKKKYFLKIKNLKFKIAFAYKIETKRA